MLQNPETLINTGLTASTSYVAMSTDFVDKSYISVIILKFTLLSHKFKHLHLRVLNLFF